MVSYLKRFFWDTLYMVITAFVSIDNSLNSYLVGFVKDKVLSKYVMIRLLLFSHDVLVNYR